LVNKIGEVNKGEKLFILLLLNYWKILDAFFYFIQKLNL